MELRILNVCCLVVCIFEWASSISFHSKRARCSTSFGFFNQKFFTRSIVRNEIRTNTIIQMSASGEDMHHEEWELERKVQKLEKRIRVAVAEERYEEACKLRDALSRLHIDDAGAVLAANSEFYLAFSKKNKEKMAGLWLDSDHVLCVHPGQEPIIGYDNVTTAWARMFSSRDTVFINSVINAKGVRISVKGTFAWVTCTEEVCATRDQPASRTLLATNMFIKTRGRWWMVHHHASQSQASGQGNKGDSLDSMQNMGQLTPTIRYIKPGELGSFLSEHSNDENKLGHMKDVLEALSDLLNEGNGDDENETVDMDVQFVGGLQLPNVPTFHVATPGLQGPAAHGIVIESDKDSNDDKNDEANSSNQSSISSNLARKTVDAIRRLGREGKLSEQEKVQLITDIIKHAAGEEASMAEIAYELLIAHDNEDMSDLGRVEDFVDQCKSLTELIASRNQERHRRQ